MRWLFDDEKNDEIVKLKDDKDSNEKAINFK